MKELKCPNCGSVFSVDEEDYASIVNQVKNAEFDAEIERRIGELNSRHRAEQELAAAKAAQKFQQQLAQKELEIGAKEAEIGRIRGEKDSEITLLKNRLQSIEVQKDSERSVALAETEKRISELKSSIQQYETKLQMAIMEERTKAQQNLQNKELEIARLK